MKKSSSLFVISLVALLLTACKPSSPKKRKSSGDDPSTSASVNPTSVVPGSSSATPGSFQTSTSTSSLPPSPTEGYEECEEAYHNNDKDSLLSALRKYASQGQPGSYNDLWQTYKTVYVRDDGKMFDYYSNISNFTPGKDQAGQYNQEGDVYNREHSIPKSWWGGGTTTGTQGCDPYLVIPTDGWVNNVRDNYSFGYVASVKTQSANGFCKLGPSKTDWISSGTTVFEPDDSLKGDLARIQLYAIARYAGSYNWTQETNARLCFSGKIDDNIGFTDYAVRLFSYWSQLDPVSDWEITVSDRCEPIYGCRNPFVDHPEYANLLWGHNSKYTPYSH